MNQRLVVLPGVFRPRSDTWMLAEHLVAELEVRERVLELCTGSGAIAVAAARAGAAVTAVDVSRRAVLTTRINAALNRVRVRTLRGDLFAPVAGQRFDVIVSNPPYVPGAEVPTRGPARAWEGGPAGRVLVDRICDEAPAYLAPGGTLLMIHSSITGTDATLERLRAAGLDATVRAAERGPLGPLMRGRTAEQEEELVVIAGRRAG